MCMAVLGFNPTYKSQSADVVAFFQSKLMVQRAPRWHFFFPGEASRNVWLSQQCPVRVDGDCSRTLSELIGQPHTRIDNGA